MSTLDSSPFDPKSEPQFTAIGLSDDTSEPISAARFAANGPCTAIM